MSTGEVLTLIIRPRNQDGYYPISLHCFEIIDGYLYMKEDDLQSYGDSLRGMMSDEAEEIADRSSNKSNDYAEGDSRRPFHNLAKEGRWLFDKIFDAEKSSGIRNALISILQRDTVKRIHIVTDDFIIPWELLFYPIDGDENNFNNFWGAKWVIWRRFSRGNVYSNLPNPSILATLDKPNIKLTIGRDLDYATQEGTFFQELHVKSILNVIDLLENLADMEEFSRKCEQNADIFHFACHARMIDDRLSDSYLRLTDDFKISLNYIERELHFSGWPFVFLNACSTGWHNARHSFNFVQRFLKASSRGVIATDSDIPDISAALFAVEFYKRFLGIDEHGTPQTLGASLLGARRELIEKYQNPIGLFYGLYADPDIHIERIR